MSSLPIRPITKPQSQPSQFQESLRDGRVHLVKSILDPVLFAQVWLQCTLWDKQREILEAVKKYPRVAVKACHSSSKTFTASIAVLWFIASNFDEGICVTTAPTWNQVKNILWGEINSRLLNCKFPFPKANQVLLRLGPKRYASGLSTSVTKNDEGVKFQGIHAKNVLVVIDEAPGIDPKIWEAIEGARAGGNVKVLALGNPTIASGPFHDAFTENRAGWKTFTIDAFDTPNLRGYTLNHIINEMTEEELDNNSHPYLTTRRWVKEKYFEWGVDHPSWQSRVRGQFPTQSEDALISLAWLEQASIRQLVSSGSLQAGLDVAGPGEDETSLTIRQGSVITFHKQWAKSDPRGEVVAALSPYKEYLTAVNVDSIGIGWGMYQHLLDHGFPAIPINITEKARDSEHYADQKAEYYWGLRTRLEQGDIAGLVDEKTIGQLAGIRYYQNSRGQVEIESKEDAARRGVKSPDRAESVMLAFATRKVQYGALDFYSEVGSDLSRQLTLKDEVRPAYTPTTCEKCYATCISRCSGGYRCNQCGFQWSLNANKPAQMVPKRDAFLAKAARETRFND